MLLRILSIIAAIVAAFLFAISALVNVTTGNPLHYIGWGLVLLAASLALYVLSTIVEARVP